MSDGENAAGSGEDRENSGLSLAVTISFKVVSEMGQFLTIVIITSMVFIYGIIVVFAKVIF